MYTFKQRLKDAYLVLRGKHPALELWTTRDEQLLHLTESLAQQEEVIKSLRRRCQQLYAEIEKGKKR